MTRILILLASVVFLSSSAWSAGTLKVTSPNGGQSWTTGKSYAIKWSKGNAGATVKIQLLKSNKHYKWISKKTKNDGKLVWKIPTTVVTSSAYKIKIVSIKNKKVFDTSNKTFKITKATSGGTLKVTTPNGGQKWTTGKTYQIKWSKGNAGAKVKILLLKNGKAYKWISKSTANDGKHTWKIPATVATASTYKIKITSTTKKKVTDSSNKNFKITKAVDDGDSLEVISPNGGETWKKGSVVSIKWEKGSIGGKVGVYLYKSGKRYKTITANTANDGERSWTVPTTLATGSAYKVRVQSKTTPTKRDDSDRNFTISGSSSKTPTVSLSCSSSSFAENGGTSTCTVSLSKSTTKVVTVKLAYSGTATAGTDYSGNYTSRTISAGKTSTSWKLTGKSDSKTEGNETIVINVTSVTNATEDGTQRESITLSEKVVGKITVSSPNGGESWKHGQTKTISWSSNNAGSYVDINLYSGGAFVTTIASETSNDGSYNWTVASSISEGSNFKLRVSDSDDSSVYGQSNSSFSISALKSCYINFVLRPCRGGRGVRQADVRLGPYKGNTRQVHTLFYDGGRGIVSAVGQFENVVEGEYQLTTDGNPQGTQIVTCDDDLRFDGALPKIYGRITNNAISMAWGPAYFVGYESGDTNCPSADPHYCNKCAPWE